MKSSHTLNAQGSSTLSPAIFLYWVHYPPLYPLNCIHSFSYSTVTQAFRYTSNRHFCGICKYLLCHSTKYLACALSQSLLNKSFQPPSTGHSIEVSRKTLEITLYHPYYTDEETKAQDGQRPTASEWMSQNLNPELSGLRPVI